MFILKDTTSQNVHFFEKLKNTYVFSGAIFSRANSKTLSEY